MIYLEGQALLLMLCQTFDLYLPFNVMLLVQNTFKMLQGAALVASCTHRHKTCFFFAFSVLVNHITLIVDGKNNDCR